MAFLRSRVVAGNPAKKGTGEETCSSRLFESVCGIHYGSKLYWIHRPSSEEPQRRDDHQKDDSSGTRKKGSVYRCEPTTKLPKKDPDPLFPRNNEQLVSADAKNRIWKVLAESGSDVVSGRNVTRSSQPEFPEQASRQSELGTLCSADSGNKSGVSLTNLVRSVRAIEIPEAQQRVQ